MAKQAESERLRTAFTLFEAGREMKRAQLRRQHPTASEEEISEALGRWLRTRPGAENGDAEGPPGTWPRQP